MKKIDAYIEIVGSSNPRLNAMAEDSQQTMLAVLGKQYTKVGITLVDNQADLEGLVAKKPDLVVLGMKLVLLDPSKSYDDSPKVWLSNYLKQHQIAFTGSDTDALMLEFNKHEAKQKVINAGLQSSAYFVSTILSPTFKHTLRFPLFVKPTNRGDSKGIDEKSVVYSDIELASKITSIHKDYSSDALVEEYLPGREFSVAVLRMPSSEVLHAMPIEIKAPADKQGNCFLSEAVKEADSEKVMAVTDPTLKAALNALAVGVFEALGSRDYGRIDMRLDSLGVPQFIEANLMPGLSDHGYLSRCFYLNNQVGYSEMISAIVELALEKPVRNRIKPGLAPAPRKRSEVASLAGVGIVV
jgi:D-alanine-D-alanine ligase